MKRSQKLQHAIQSISENKELLDRLGSDYENGIPYWENMECECGKIMCPKCSEVGR